MDRIEKLAGKVAGVWTGRDLGWYESAGMDVAWVATDTGETLTEREISQYVTVNSQRLGKMLQKVSEMAGMNVKEMRRTWKLQAAGDRNIQVVTQALLVLTGEHLGPMAQVFGPKGMRP